ncbi:MAG: hypothetical protein J5953_04715 [Prevotella sp.]|nr:hypothetical protein [Prevotella sp.]
MELNKKHRLVILDDDPTGIQTVHGCLLITQWDAATVRMALQHEQPFFYMLTNTRAMTREEAARVVRSAMEKVLEVNRELGYRLIFISRSDSCLRGHFPLETDVMRQVLREYGVEVWPRVPLCPALIEAGRVTVDGVHYMKDGERLIPVSETEFARDNVFAYHTSVLSDYIREKGADSAEYQIVNAATYEELYAFADSLYHDIKDFSGAVVIRSSSSLPKAMSGIGDKPLLDRSMLKHDGVGCFIVGSHVQKTTRQLNALLSAEGVAGIEVDVERVLRDGEALTQEMLSAMKDRAGEGLTPVVYTSRREVRLNDADERQHLGQRISDFLVSLVARLPFVPSYLVAKGGITSNDILIKGLALKSAEVLGQIVPNVPCVMTTHFPYIIFPGNVGGDDSLREVYEKLRNVENEKCRK